MSSISTPSQPSPILQATEAFHAEFGGQATHLVRAPGRVNLIGEHVDYNDGPVLPLAIELEVVIAARTNGTSTGRIRSSGWRDIVEIPLTAEPQRGQPSWANYVRGVMAGFQRRGVVIPGFDAFITTSLPHGCGLSSSAALEVATATLIESLTGHAISKADKALLCQKAEHEFAGVPCGIMDQFASVFGKKEHAILIDCQSREVTPIPIRGDDIAFLIIDTRVKHSLGDSEYAVRRRSCEEAAAALGVPSLRSWTVAKIPEAEAKMDPIPFKRARHIITEIARTFESIEYLRAGEWEKMGELMYQSHDSLRDDFAVSCAELDEIVRIARDLGLAHGIYGCRMTGGGFGGSAIAIVKKTHLAEVQSQIAEQYKFPKGVGFISTTAANGAEVIKGDAR